MEIIRQPEIVEVEIDGIAFTQGIRCCILFFGGNDVAIPTPKDPGTGSSNL
jgi:hypothetical protein